MCNDLKSVLHAILKCKILVLDSVGIFCKRKKKTFFWERVGWRRDGKTCLPPTVFFLNTFIINACNVYMQIIKLKLFFIQFNFTQLKFILNKLKYTLKLMMICKLYKLKTV